MSNEEILDSWREPIKNAVLETFHRFKAEPKIILIESDLKCNLYMDLINQKPYVQYAVHTEVTHYIGSRDDNGSRKYRFRDMSLLCPWLIKDNEELWGREKTLSKGFKHKGPAIHIELKIQRQGQSENEINQINHQDITRLSELHITEGREKRYVIIWLSRDNYNDAIVTNVLNALKQIKKPQIIKLIEVYLIDKSHCKRLFFENNWVPIDL
jgi:hypothetical protein